MGSALLLVFNFGLQFLKWKFLLNNRFQGISSATAFQSLLFGSTLGFVTPGNLGELARALYIKQHDRWVITGLNVIDKLFSLLIFTTLGLVSLNYIFIHFFNLQHYALYPIIFFSLIFLLMVWSITLNPQKVSSFLKNFQRSDSLRSRFQSFTSALENFKRSDSIYLAFLNILWFVIILLQYHLAVLAFAPVSLMPSFLAVSSLMLTKIALPISFADLGIREGAAVFYYALFEVPKAAAFSGALLIFVINFLLPALAGSYYVFRLRSANQTNNVNDRI